MSQALFKFLLTGAILLQLSAIIEDELNARTATGVFAADGLLAAATMIRPRGIFLPLFAPLPFLLMKGVNWARELVFGVLACAISIAPMLAWTARNERVVGVGTTDTDSAKVLYYYDAADVLSYAAGRNCFAVQDELHRQGDNQGKIHVLYWPSPVAWFAKVSRYSSNIHLPRSSLWLEASIW